MMTMMNIMFSKKKIKLHKIRNQFLLSERSKFIHSDKTKSPLEWREKNTNDLIGWSILMFRLANSFHFQMWLLKN